MGDEMRIQRDNGRVLDCLQEAVNAETTTRNLYWSRAVLWRSVGVKRLAKYYRQQSEENHAQRSADRMAQLGRQPKIDPTGVDAITEDSVTEHFRMDLAVEVELADSYRDWIKIAEEAGDYVTRQVWCGVLASTDEHVDFLQGELRQIKLMGEQNYLATWR